MEQSQGNDINKLIIGSVISVLLIVGSLFAAYRYSQSQKSEIVLPGGVTYLGPTNTPAPLNNTPPSTDQTPKFQSTNTKWKEQNGSIYPYTVSFPLDMKIIIFPKDPNDSIAFEWQNIPVEENIVLNIEKKSDRAKEFTGKPTLEYVRKWYTAFPGLTGIKTVDPIKTASGLSGYKAIYINTSGETPNTDVFLEVPGNKNLLIHLASGRLSDDLFIKIVDSVKWTN